MKCSNNDQRRCGEIKDRRKEGAVKQGGEEGMRIFVEVEWGE
jgi:hypothetical protein